MAAKKRPPTVVETLRYAYNEYVAFEDDRLQGTSGYDKCVRERKPYVQVVEAAEEKGTDAVLVSREDLEHLLKLGRFAVRLKKLGVNGDGSQMLSVPDKDEVGEQRRRVEIRRDSYVVRRVAADVRKGSR